MTFGSFQTAAAASAVAVFFSPLLFAAPSAKPSAERVAALDAGASFVLAAASRDAAAALPADRQALLLRRWARGGDEKAKEAALQALRTALAGPGRDVLGGGFFDVVLGGKPGEKSLAVQASMALALLEAKQASGEEVFAEAAREALDGLVRDLKGPRGGFAARLQGTDAQWGWTAAQVEQALGPEDGPLALFHLGLEGAASPRLPSAARTEAETARRFELLEKAAGRRLRAAKTRLLALRAVSQPSEEASLAAQAWALSALARGAQVLDEAAYLAEARSRGGAVKKRVLAGRGLAREASPRDAALLGAAYLDLYEAGFDPSHLDAAFALGEAAAQGAQGAEEGSEPWAPPPAGPARAALWLRLAQSGDERSAARAETELAKGEALTRRPERLGWWGPVFDFSLSKPAQIVLAGEAQDPLTVEMLKLVRSRFLPSKVVFLLEEGPSREKIAKRMPFLKMMKALRGRTTAYVCVRFACEFPTHDLGELAEILDGKRRGG